MLEEGTLSVTEGAAQSPPVPSNLEGAVRSQGPYGDNTGWRLKLPTITNSIRSILDVRRIRSSIKAVVLKAVVMQKVKRF